MGMTLIVQIGIANIYAIYRTPGTHTSATETMVSYCRMVMPITELLLIVYWGYPTTHDLATQLQDPHERAKPNCYLLSGWPQS